MLCECVYIFDSVHIYIYIYTYMYTYVCTNVCIHVYACVCVYLDLPGADVTHTHVCVDLTSAGT